MKEINLKVIQNELVAKDIYKMVLEGDTSAILQAGQFVELQLPGHYLRRPISVSDFDDKTVTLLYKVVGSGTKDMSYYQPGSMINTLTGLGNGFFKKDCKKPLLIGGGIGIAPMFKLAMDYNQKGIQPTIVYAAASSKDLACIDELSKIGTLLLCTDDGSIGFHGNCVELLKQVALDFDYYYACGPLPMLKALQQLPFPGCLSLEARMGCGFGACMGCSIQTTNGPRCICKDGPVFKSEEVIF